MSGLGPRAPADLVLAICHQVGNHLAAARLSAYWAAQARGRGERLQASRAVEAVTTQAAALLAQVRPLLAPSRRSRARASPASVLEALVQEIESLSGFGPELILRRAPRVPDVSADPALLHALLLALVLRTEERSEESRPVRLSIVPDARARRVAFVVEHREPGEARRKPSSELPPGTALAVRAAERVLRQWGGRLVVRPRRGGTRLELLLPLAGPMPGRAASARGSARRPRGVRRRP